MLKKLLSLKRKVFLLLTSILLSFGVHAQVTITGKVTSSEDQMPVIGATVVIKGTKQGTTTNADGSFALTASPTDVIVVSFLGFTPQQIKVGDQKTINVVLIADASTLTEVVVTGYTSQRKKDLTGAVAVVDVAQLKSQPAASAVEALQGKAPGVQIVNDGAPGSTPQIRVRGITTINNNDPLFVVDGVPYEGKLY
jgi:outer membrane receptor protein involved in Fe transport